MFPFSATFKYKCLDLHWSWQRNGILTILEGSLDEHGTVSEYYLYFAKNATLGTFKVKIDKILLIARSVKIHFKRLCYRPNLLGYILLQLVSFQTKSRDKLP